MKYTPPRPRLTDTTVMKKVCDALNENLPLEADGYVCSGTDLWQILVGASAKQATIHGVCAGVENAPSDRTVRGYLNEQLRVDDLPDIEQRLNAALAAQIPRRVFKTARDTAMDFHDQAYYGKTAQAEGLWVRAEAKDGTTRVYRVATAYVIWRDMRVTLAIEFVLPEDDTVSILSDLLKRLKALKYRVKTLYLDRGFDGVRVMRFVTKTRLTAVIACTIRGKTGGTRALCRGRGSYRTTYTFNSPEHGHFTARLAVCKVFTTARRTGRNSRRADWLIFIMMRCAFTPKQVRQAYRRRFGIEIVQSQMTKASVFASLGSGYDVTDFDITIGDDHAINQEFDQLPLVLKIGAGQASLDTLTELGHRTSDCGKLRVLIGLTIQLLILTRQCINLALQFSSPALIFRQRDDGTKVGLGQTLQLSRQMNLCFA